MGVLEVMIIEFLPCFPEDRCLRGVEDEEGGGRSAVSRILEKKIRSTTQDR